MFAAFCCGAEDGNEQGSSTEPANRGVEEEAEEV